MNALVCQPYLLRRELHKAVAPRLSSLCSCAVDEIFERDHFSIGCDKFENVLTADTKGSALSKSTATLDLQLTLLAACLSDQSRVCVPVSKYQRRKLRAVLE